MIHQLNGGTMRIRTILSATTTAVALLLAGGAPAQAADDHGVAPSATSTQREIDALLKLYPGSRQIDATTVDLGRGGAQLHLPSPASASASTNEVVAAAAGDHCQRYYLCLFEHANYAGKMISFTSCRTEDLRTYPFYPGAPQVTWANRVSSIDNDQDFWGKDTYFMYVGAGNEDHFMFSMYDVDTRASLSGGWNDTIDKVKVC